MLEGLKARMGISTEKVAEYSEKQKMVKLIMMILIPFYAVWFGFNFLFFFEYPIEWSTVWLVCGLFSWGTGFVMLLNSRQMEASQYHCFRGLTWRMSVTDRIKGDIYVDQKIEYIGYLGGFQVYKPHFPFALGYDHPNYNNGDGISFDDAYWFLPDKWEQTFFHIPQQEAWYGALPVSVKGEDVTLHNIGWGIKDGKYTPCALVVDSNRHFEATLGRCKIETDKQAPLLATLMSQLATLTKDNIEVKLELASEVQTNRGLLKATETQEELVRERVQDIKKRHSDIKRMPTPWKFPKINYRLIVLLGMGISAIAFVWWLVATYW